MLGSPATPGARDDRSVLIVTHLFPSDNRDIRGPWVAEQADALFDLANIRVLCCSQTAANRSEVRPSGVPVTFRSTSTLFGPRLIPALQPVGESCPRAFRDP